MSEKWMNTIREGIKHLKGLKPKDRLAFVNALGLCWFSVHGSQLGWAKWLRDVSLLSKLDEEFLGELFERYRSHAIAFLEFDLYATEKTMKKLAKPKKKDEGIGIA